MANLPVEVMQLIFSQLATRDKLECMTVCRQWHDAIQLHCLFRVIYIHHQHQLNHLIQKVKEQPIFGTKVERITLELKPEWTYDAAIFEKLFQNLRALTVINIDNNNHGIDFSQLCHFHSWRVSFEEIVETHSDLHTRTLLLSGVCVNLTYIAITGQEQRVVRTLDLLTYAPALKILHLNSYTVSFDDLDLLHQNVPGLHSLLLNHVELTARPYFNPIKPATSMKSFRCISCYFGSGFDINPHLKYISQKYTHLEELEPQFEPLDYEDDDTRDLMYQQRAMMASYFKTLGAQLKILSLTIDGPNSDASSECFDLLDEAGCRIETMKLLSVVDISALQRLATSTQVKYITSLMVNEVSPYASSVSFEWIRGFIALKHLSLHFPFTWRVPERMALDLSHLVENQLETLFLEFVHLKFGNDDPTRIQTYPSLKELTLSRITFEPGTDVAISTMFPNLRRLKLDHCFERKGSFMLPRSNLSYLEVINVNRGLPIMVITLGNNQRRLYYASVKPYSFYTFDTDIQRDMFTLPSMSSQPVDNNSKVTPVLTITCHSLYDFFMVNEER